ncbi:hypothetical protein [Vibrio sp. 1074]|nr:hypothetical protein [Vibrio sp. 1074]MDW2277648.1 hypothetical protein [Vibrio sp. 1074]
MKNDQIIGRAYPLF